MTDVAVAHFPFTIKSDTPVQRTPKELRDDLGVDGVNPQLAREGRFDGRSVVKSTSAKITKLPDFYNSSKIANALRSHNLAPLDELELFLLLRDNQELKDRFPLIIALGREFHSGRGEKVYPNVWLNQITGASGLGLLEVGELRPGEALAVKPLG